MTRYTIAAAALNQTPLAWSENLARIQAVIHEARSRNIQLLCLPEMCLSGYGVEDAFLRPDTELAALNSLRVLIKETANLAVTFGLPLRHQGILYNVIAFVADQQLLGFSAKQQLANTGVHYEPRWFTPWPAGVRAQLNNPHWSGNVMFGDMTYTYLNCSIGLEICEEAWVQERSAYALKKQRVDIVLNPSASHFAMGKYAMRQQLVQEGARIVNGIYVYANLLGNEAGRLIYDGDTLIADATGTLCQGPRFSFRDHVLMSVEVDLGKRYITNSACNTQTNAVEDKLADLTHALSLGLFDYLRKSQSLGFVVSLSGGADSAMVACLVACMFAQALQEFDHESLMMRLFNRQVFSPIPQSLAAWMQACLTCVYQKSAYSSAQTERLARLLAEALGANFYSLNIAPLVEQYETIASTCLNHEIDQTLDDLAKQNIQARVRAPMVWLIANLKRALLLSTSNRNEASVGYCTMDGDTAGGLCPIGGVDKPTVHAWLRDLLMRARHQPSPIFVAGTNLFMLETLYTQAPTAELRDPSLQQTDEKDLMPYVILTAIERAYVFEQLDKNSIMSRLINLYPMYTQSDLHTFVDRFFTLLTRNQWKRERLAPSFHVDDYNVDPKTGWRFPILSGDVTKASA